MAIRSRSRLEIDTIAEAIHQNVVKHPVLPDAASREKLREEPSAIFTEKYADYLELGIEEWRKSYAEHEPLGKKAVLFVMVKAVDSKARAHKKVDPFWLRLFQALERVCKLRRTRAHVRPAKRLTRL